MEDRGRGRGRGRGGRGQGRGQGRGGGPDRGDSGSQVFQQRGGYEDRGGGRGGRGGGRGGRDGDFPPPESTQSRPQSAQPSFRPTTVSSSAQAAAYAAAAPISLAPSTPGAQTTVARPGFGKLGRRIRVFANLFSVSIPDRDIIRYDVTIKPDGVPKSVCRLIMNQWKHAKHDDLKWGPQDYENVQTVAYDGMKIMYSAKPIKGIGNTFVEFPIELQEEDGDASRMRKFTLAIRTIKPVQMEVLHTYLQTNRTDISLEIPYEAISCLEVLLRQSPALRFTTNPAGRCFYSDQGQEILPHGLAVHFGWYQSLRTSIGLPRDDSGVTYKQLLMNLDVAATAFYQQGPLVNVVFDFFGVRNYNEMSRILDNKKMMLKLDKFLNNLMVDITYRSTGRRRYKIRGISARSAGDTRIVIKDEATGKESKLSVHQFFQQHYNITLNYPGLPCVLAGAQGNIQIPMELCIVRPNQRYVRKIDEKQQADMVKVTAVPPQKRKERIYDGLNQLHGDHDKKYLDLWGIHINGNMTEVNARVLDPPKMMFNPNPISTPLDSSGTWRFDQKKRYSKPGAMVAWSVAVFGNNRDIRPQELGKFLDGLCDYLSSMGISVVYSGRAEDYAVYERRRGDFMGTLQEAKRIALAVGEENMKLEGARRTNDRQVDLVLCVLPNKSSLDYNEIKRISEVNLGLMTQCCIGKHVKQAKIAYFGNLALKINAKLGGVNSFVEAPKGIPFLDDNFPTMIFGADVTHPPAGVKEGVSIAAVVGSIDKRFCEYRSSIRVQGGRKEIIEDLCEMILELIGYFRKRSPKFAPKRILFYRDGVSEGQFGEVVTSEVAALKRALQKVGLTSTTLTFVIVSKRHHIRFFPTNNRESDRSGNVLAGTVVDTGIVHPFEFDFFLNSHPGLQGTSRPAHYHVLYDENRFSADALQDLTYKLCYLYCRSTRAVSIVPAAYYAHLVAARARCHIGDDASDNASVVSNRSLEALQQTRIVEEIANSMFFT